MLRIQTSNKREQQNLEHQSGPLDFGRGPERDGVPRCVLQDAYVSADHMRIEQQGDALLVQNLSKRNTVRLHDSSRILQPGDSALLPCPLRLILGETAVDIELEPELVETGPLDTVAAPLRLPASPAFAASPTPQSLNIEVKANLSELGKAPTPERLMEWFETFVAVQRAAAGSPQFFQQTAEAVVKLVGLDRGLIILRAPGSKAGPGSRPRWMVQARYPGDGGEITGREFSTTILDRVLADGRTYFQSNASLSTSAESLQGVEAVVASPIFDAANEVVGFVYGCRTRFSLARGGVGIGPLEAQVMQVLAAAVGAGLARQQQEAEAAKARVQFEQFFSPELALELQRNPSMLEGVEREITILFSDVRNFSRLSERLGPRLTCELVADVMERLTACIRRHDGTIVDYLGDGLIAMWNAPLNQADHARQACLAALDMLAVLPELSADWQDRLGTPVRVGIGVNSGPAMCGNTGSKTRFKYGPLGHAVNLASRVESATKQMGVPLLITGSTRALVGDHFATRRLCKVRVVGIHGAVDFYELNASAEHASPEWNERAKVYEQALTLYESGQFGDACATLYSLLARDPSSYDMPSLNLLTRSVEALKNPPGPGFDGVLELHSK